MSVQQVSESSHENSLIPAEVAAAATRYQAYRTVEAEHLAMLGAFNPAQEWTPEVRQLVFRAGDHMRHARDARATFRSHVREFVVALRSASEPLAAVHRHTRSMLRLLEGSGAVVNDRALEEEVIRWTTEEYETMA